MFRTIASKRMHGAAAPSTPGAPQRDPGGPGELPADAAPPLPAVETDPQLLRATPEDRTAAPRPMRADGFDLSGAVEPVRHLPTTPWAFLSYLVRRQFLGRILLLAALSFLAQGFDSVGPWALAQLVNALATSLGLPQTTALAVPLPLPWPEAWPVAFGWLLVLGLTWAIGLLLFRTYEVAELNTHPELREVANNLLFGYLLGHSPRYFQDNFAGKLGQKIKQAGQASVQILNILSFEAPRLVVTLAIGGGLLFAANPVFGAVLLGWTVVYIAVQAWFARRCVRLSKGYHDQVSTATGRLIDAIANADLIRAFAKHPYERRFYAGYVAEERQRSKRLRLFVVVMRLYQLAAILSFLVAVTGIAIADVLAQRMSVGTFTMVFTLVLLIAQTVQGIANRLLEFFETYGAVAEAIELVTQPHEIVDKPGAPALVVSSGAIRFEHVRFAHRSGQAVFDDLCLDIAPGEKIGLVGRSGAGKTTLVRLLRRQFEPQQGRILIDGQDIAAVSWDSLNEAIAEVPQAPGIFHRPVRDNIRYARMEAPDEVTMRAAEQAHAHAFIMARPTGYDTIVGEQGIKLSGGERQRVAVARALVKDARILVLDEATSSLDSESEHLIQEALFKLMQGRTVIAIAHRLSTVTGMDRIVYLDQGRILEHGSHAELLAKGGLYARLWQRQIGGFLDADRDADRAAE